MIHTLTTNSTLYLVNRYRDYLEDRIEKRKAFKLTLAIFTVTAVGVILFILTGCSTPNTVYVPVYSGSYSSGYSSYDTPTSATSYNVGDWRYTDFDNGSQAVTYNVGDFQYTDFYP